MRRSLKTWKLCEPSAMTEQSPAAICYAFEDAQADILELAEQLERMKLMLARIAYPARNTPDDFADLNMFSAEIQATWSMENLEANTPVRPHASGATDGSETPTLPDHE